MKRLLIATAVLALAGAVQGQKKKAAQAPQSGQPAVLEAGNGKKARVFLQSLENGTLVFEPYKSTKEISVPAGKVKHLEFILKYDAAGVSKAFDEGDYDAVVATLGSLFEPYVPYMVIDNNLRDDFAMLMEAYREKGNFSEARKAAKILLESGDPLLILRGQAVLALAAIAEKDFQTAEKIQTQVSSEAAGLYLKAAIERAKSEPKTAIQTAVGIIADHGNDMEWLPPAELLCAQLYLDMGMTNSAAHTARQVENIYAGTHISADAARLRAPLKADEPEPVVEEEPAAEEMETTGSATNQTPAAEAAAKETAPEEPTPEPMT